MFCSVGISGIEQASVLHRGGPDKLAGAVDDSYIASAVLGFTTCLDSFGKCGSARVFAMVAPGPDNELVECLQCTAQSAGVTLIGSYVPESPLL